MALRVLLADESSTIKKVIQLALQDFAVEVKSVPNGLDVLPVAKSFKPDLIFVDVLLTKRSGYEVCHELKSDMGTQIIPIILMWSGFMEIDEAKASSCGADRRLEKPFDADLLRSMVNELVPKTKANPIAQFLTFPEMPEFVEDRILDEKPINLQEKDDLYSIPEEPEFSQNIAPLAVEDEFSSVPLTQQKEDRGIPEDSWSHQSLNRFKLEIPDESSAGNFANKYVIPSIENDEELLKEDSVYEEISFEDASLLGRSNKKEQPFEDATRVGISLEAPVKPKMPPPQAANASSTNKISLQASYGEDALSSSQKRAEPPPAHFGVEGSSRLSIDETTAERILREEARQVIENLAWKLLPDITERIVREEIKKLLQDVEKSI